MSKLDGYFDNVIISLLAVVELVRNYSEFKEHIILKQIMKLFKNLEELT